MNSYECIQVQDQTIELFHSNKGILQCWILWIDIQWSKSMLLDCQLRILFDLMELYFEHEEVS